MSTRAAIASLAAVVISLIFAAAACAQSSIATARITSQTTTTVLAAVAAKSAFIYAGSVCVDGNGVATGVAIQDTAGTNLVGTDKLTYICLGY